MDVPLFEQVAEVVHSLAPEDLGLLKSRSHRRGIKIWFDADKPTRTHFEAQVMARRHVDGLEGLAIEVGFHSEHKELERNIQVLDRLEANEKKWRRRLGSEAEMGVFFAADGWRRLSEVWIEPDLEDPDLAFELAARLVDYVSAIAPITRMDE